MRHQLVSTTLMVALLVATLVLLLSSVNAQCGAPNCYSSPCNATAVQKLDFVFIIDVSASMSAKISGVTTGGPSLLLLLLLLLPSSLTPTGLLLILFRDDQIC